MNWEPFAIRPGGVDAGLGLWLYLGVLFDTPEQ